MEIKDFKFNDWENQWSGSWSLLSISYWGDLYIRKPFTDKIDRYVDNTIMIVHKNKSIAYQRSSEKEIFGRKFNELVKLDKNYVNLLCDKVKMNADKFLAFTKGNYQKDLPYNKYLEFQDLLVNQYYPLHIQIKVGTDYLDRSLLDKYLSKIESTRVYIEPVFDWSEKFMVALAKIQAKKVKYDYQLILSTVKDEFHHYLINKKGFPKKKELEERYENAALLVSNGKISDVYCGKKVSEIEALAVALFPTKIIKGISAYQGKVTGKVKIVHNPNKAEGFNQGDILVAGMTRPDYLPLMKKAAAFITDGGGILCHAAIVARELRKPCVIGTKIATKVLKDGDVVEVDANKGIVRKLN